MFSLSFSALLLLHLRVPFPLRAHRKLPPHSRAMTLLSWSLLFLGIVLPNSKSLSTALRYGHGEQLRFLVEDSQTARVPRRFLHITDMHIDPHYDVSADPSYLCHSREKSFGGLNVEDAGVDVLNLTMGLRDPIASAWNKDFSGSGKRVAGSGPGVMGYYGAPVTGCDSPIALINITFDFLQSYITTTKLDFVVWTGSFLFFTLAPYLL